MIVNTFSTNGIKFHFNYYLSSTLVVYCLISREVKHLFGLKDGLNLHKVLQLIIVQLVFGEQTSNSEYYYFKNNQDNRIQLCNILSLILFPWLFKFNLLLIDFSAQKVILIKISDLSCKLTGHIETSPFISIMLFTVNLFEFL